MATDHPAGVEIARLERKYDEYVVAANARVCEMYRTIEVLLQIIEANANADVHAHAKRIAQQGDTLNGH